MVPVGDQNMVEAAPPAPDSEYAESEPDVEDKSPDEPLAEPTQDDIDAWMSPKRAREKQLLLNGQYRISAQCRQKIKTRDDTIDRFRTKYAKLKIAYKGERMRRMAAEKIMNDILKMLEKWFPAQTRNNKLVYFLTFLQ